MSVYCVHCGEDCGKEAIEWDGKSFCCAGCKTVYQLLSENRLYTYYDLEKTPGIKITTEDFGKKFAYLDNQEICDKLFEFSEGDFRKITFFIPSIHCSSCIWLLENLNKLNKGILQSRVNFVKKQITISFMVNELSLRQLVELLASIHYVPVITLEDIDRRKASSSNKNLLYKIGYAGFAFGNTMLFSFPEYIQGAFGIESRFRILFGILNLLFAIPLITYSARDYLLSAFKNLKHKNINIDFPIALGMLAIFFQSSYEILSQSGAGYMDSLCGFVFFLLIGKWYQNKTYQALSFDRDYKSYFPVAVTKIGDKGEQSILLEKLDEGDTILIHNSELIPADSVILKGTANLDYSFVTGESRPVRKFQGDIVYAGGRQMGSSIELKVTNRVEQSQLTSLWNLSDKKETNNNLSKLIDRVSRKFTLIILLISILTAIFWGIYNPDLLIKAFSSVLIVACPCALALSIPFAYGNTMRLMGKKGFYLKNSEVVEKLTHFDTIVFDKTGTITQTDMLSVDFVGNELSIQEINMIKSLVRHSTHPLSACISNLYSKASILQVENYDEIPSKGLSGQIEGVFVKLGSESFLRTIESMQLDTSSRVYISFNNEVKGYYRIRNKYRQGLKDLIIELGHKYDLHLLSGDNDSEKINLIDFFGSSKNFHFNQNPVDKLNYIKNLKEKGKNVLMIGDGLNDSGALNEANVSISIADDAYHFSPACDSILESGYFENLFKYIKASKHTIKVVKIGFMISFLYNIIGISFAVSGQLSPIVAAILMPMSSVTAVAFVTLATSFIQKRN